MRALIMSISMVALLAIGCSDRETSVAEEPVAETPAAEMSPEELGELGAAIAQRPEEGNRMLAERGLTEEQFEAEIRRVSSDPELSKRYATTFRTGDV